MASVGPFAVDDLSDFVYSMFLGVCMYDIKYKASLRASGSPKQQRTCLA